MNIAPATQLTDIEYIPQETDTPEMEDIELEGKTYRETTEDETSHVEPVKTPDVTVRRNVAFTSQGMATEQYYIDDSARKIVSRYGHRARVTILNTEDSGGENLYIGSHTQVSTTNGFLIKPDKGIVLETESEIWAVASATGLTVCVLVEWF